MPFHRSHDRVYCEPPRHDELLDGVPANVNVDELARARQDRTKGGRFKPGASTAQVKGGKTRKGTTALAAKLGIADLECQEDFRPYLVKARAWRKATCSELARTVGGGVCGIIESSMVKTAALQFAGSEYWFAKAAASGSKSDWETASKLGDAARMGLNYAREMCAKNALNRPKQSVVAMMRAAVESENE